MQQAGKLLQIGFGCSFGLKDEKSPGYLAGLQR
jgi:hypothetical protein